MKRFKSISGAILFLSVLLLALPQKAFPQVPSGEFFDYIVVQSGYGLGHYMIFKNGDVFNRHDPPDYVQWEPGSLHPMGNFWGSLPPHTDMIRYRITISADQMMHFVLLSNGDAYMRIVYGENGFSGNPFYLGNYWGNPVSTDKSTWSGIKGKVK